MKRIIFIFSCLLFLYAGQAQTLIFEDDFESSSPTSCSERTECTFGFIDEFGCAPNWAISHGTPWIFDPFSSTSTTHIRMHAFRTNSGQTDIGEGIFTVVRGNSFVPGRTYHICFDYTTPVDNGGNEAILFAYLANNMTHDPGSENDETCLEPIPNIPGAQQIVSQEMTDLDGEWLSAEWTFTVTGEVSFSNLWFYPIAIDDANPKTGNAR